MVRVDDSPKLYCRHFPSLSHQYLSLEFSNISGRYDLVYLTPKICCIDTIKLSSSFSKLFLICTLKLSEYASLKPTQVKYVFADKLRKMSIAKTSSIEAMWCFTFITFLSYSLGGSETYSHETFAFIFVDINIVILYFHLNK